MIDKLLKYVKEAGAKSESDTERDGFLSYHAESHSIGVGMGLGFLAFATGDMGLFGIIVPAITSGLRAKDKEFSKILTDVYQEPHYAMGGLVLGSLLGMGANLLVVGSVTLPV